ncbi:MAG: DUF1349 domain-containing protein [Roseburia inulinivorans]
MVFKMIMLPVFQVGNNGQVTFLLLLKTEFESTCRFDQCGVAMYLNSDNWFKASIEYENEKYSDWEAL